MTVLVRIRLSWVRIGVRNQVACATKFECLK